MPEVFGLNFDVWSERVRFTVFHFDYAKIFNAEKFDDYDISHNDVM